MRHYLDLVLIQAKVQKKQNRMTKICIFLSVFLFVLDIGYTLGLPFSAA